MHYWVVALRPFNVWLESISFEICIQAPRIIVGKIKAQKLLRPIFSKLIKEAGKRFLAELTEEAAISAGRGGTATAFTSFINRIFNKDQFSVEREKE